MTKTFTLFINLYSVKTSKKTDCLAEGIMLLKTRTILIKQQGNNRDLLINYKLILALDTKNEAVLYL